MVMLYDCLHFVLFFQVDIAPTLALLFGVPIPKNNVGMMIAEAFDSLTGGFCFFCNLSLCYSFIITYCFKDDKVEHTSGSSTKLMFHMLKRRVRYSSINMDGIGCVCTNPQCTGSSDATM